MKDRNQWDQDTFEHEEALHRHEKPVTWRRGKVPSDADMMERTSNSTQSIAQPEESALQGGYTKIKF